MWPFETYEPVLTELQPGVTYRVTYRITCINSTTAGAVSSALANLGILMTPSASLVTGVFGATDPVQVAGVMSQDAFRSALAAGFNLASADSWIACTDVQVDKIEKPVSRPIFSGAGAGFTGGLVLAAVLVGGAAYLAWRAK